MELSDKCDGPIKQLRRFGCPANVVYGQDRGLMGSNYENKIHFKPWPTTLCP